MRPGPAYDLDAWLQALRVLRHHAESRGKKLNLVQEPSRALRGNLVRQIEDEDDKTVTVETQAPGLYGALGSAPDYFTNQIIQHRDQANSLRDFMDIFNHRLLETLISIWNRNQPLLDNPFSENNPADALIRYLGKLPDDADQPLYLRCAARHHVGLFQHKPRTSHGMKALLGAFFPGLETEIEGHVARELPIPIDQQTRLDSRNPPCLGSTGNMLAGQSLPDIKGKIRIHFKQLDYRTYLRFMEGAALRERLVTLTAEYTGGRWECGLELELRAAEVPYLRLGSAQKVGSNCWLLSEPSKLDVHTRFGSLGHG